MFNDQLNHHMLEPVLRDEALGNTVTIHDHPSDKPRSQLSGVGKVGRILSRVGCVAMAPKAVVVAVCSYWPPLPKPYWI